IVELDHDLLVGEFVAILTNREIGYHEQRGSQSRQSQEPVTLHLAEPLALRKQNGKLRRKTSVGAGFNKLPLRKPPPRDERTCGRKWRKGGGFEVGERIEKKPPEGKSVCHFRQTQATGRM